MDWLGNGKDFLSWWWTLPFNNTGILDQLSEYQRPTQVPVSFSWSGTVRVKPNYLEEKRVEPAFCRPQIWHGLAWFRNRDPATTDWQLMSKLCSFEYCRCLQNNSKAEILLQKGKW